MESASDEQRARYADLQALASIADVISLEFHNSVMLLRQRLEIPFFLRAVSSSSSPPAAAAEVLPKALLALQRLELARVAANERLLQQGVLLQ